MKVNIEEIYTSVACNRIPEIVDWNNGGIVCFGATNAVVIYDTEEKGKNPLKVFSHHKSKVNSVKWICKQSGSCTEFVSCSADKTAAVWTLVDGVWRVTSSLTGHTDGVTCIHSIYTNGEDLVVYTGSIDSTVKVWERNNGVISLKQTINLNSGLCLTLHAHKLQAVNQPVLFCALDDHKIHLFAGEEYHRVHVLVGHEDWVRGLDVLDVDESSVLLASASQDTYIRLWRIFLHTEVETTTEIRVEQKLFHAYEKDWSVKLEAVLAGHEGWVYGVQWHPMKYDANTKRNVPVYRLLSSSLDKTLIIWEPESSELGEGAWVERVRVGEVGGNGLGFYGSCFGPNGKSFLGHGYNGSFHIWTLNEESREWEPRAVCGGHFGAVEDARWEPHHGRYLLSVSADQTTRLHAPWTRPDGCVQWHEAARPQLHGYDMASVAPLSATTFASAAEEKVIRVFQAPHNFLQNFHNIVGEKLVEEEIGESLAGDSQLIKFFHNKGPEGASVPSLGLSNKAVFNGESDNTGNKDDNDGYFVPVQLNAPPSEEVLMQNTLWPEQRKLYGHGHEVFALAAAPSSRLLASAARANTQEHAAVIIWETTNWQQIQKLVSHTLTVTQLAFSPDSEQLLSVSRDRKWTLYQLQQGTDTFEMSACTDKSNGVHTRIIWCCAWSEDGEVFATGSRDGKVCVWHKTDQLSSTSLRHHSLCGKPLELVNTSVTAIDFAPFTVDNKRILATGFESGLIRIYSFCIDGWCLLKELDNSAAHHLTVKRLMFNPKMTESESSKRALLASCGSDNFVRIHNVIVSL